MKSGINTQKDLFTKVKPALRTKRNELIRSGIRFIKIEDIWNYNVEYRWRIATGLTLASMVNDILNTSDKTYEDYALKIINDKKE